MNPLRSLPLLFSLLSIAALRADTIVQTATFTDANFSTGIITGMAGATFTPVFSMTVNLFDPSLGTLESVTVDHGFSFLGTYNTGTIPGGGSFSGDGNILWNTTTIGSTGGGNGGGGNSDTTLDFSFLAPPSGSATISGITSGSGLTLDLVKGTGTTSLAWNSHLVVTMDADDTFSGSLNSGSFTVTYNYTPTAVPEPGTWALMGLGLVGVLLTVKRKKTA